MLGEAKTLEQIPVVDLSMSDQEVADAIHLAAREIGFFYIGNHGIPEAFIQDAFDVTEAFFALPESQKAEVAVDETHRGWMATGMAKMEGAATHDLKEVFFFGYDLPPDHPDILAGRPMMAVNKWPASFPDLRARLTPYYDAVREVGDRVLRAVALGFGADPRVFTNGYRVPLARGQLVYYPPSRAEDEGVGRYGVAPHTDFGVLTLLLQDQNGGLQVRARSGDWIEAPPIPGTLVCNIGDLLERWTNKRFVSTLHRVVNRSGNRRFSIPVFYDPHTDWIVDPKDLGLDGTEALFEPISVGDHITSRNKRSFSNLKI